MADYVSSADDLLKRRDLVRHLRRQHVASDRVLAALECVPREVFLPDDDRDWAYADRALAIDCEQTISQPSIVAMMTEALELTGTERVLEIGTGSGYQAAILAQLAAEVFSIERHELLSKQAGAALETIGVRNVKLLVGDGSLGWPEFAPFDRIIITAAASEVPPALWDQLREEGILVAPLGDNSSQTLEAWHKHYGKAERKTLCACRFVPLIRNANPPPFQGGARGG
jgi:protein-L-isoaspartate(D-aspartate) O-methyltransferase